MTPSQGYFCTPQGTRHSWVQHLRGRKRILAFHYNHHKISNFDQNELGGLDLTWSVSYPQKDAFCERKSTSLRTSGTLLGNKMRAPTQGIFLQLSYFTQLILLAGVLSDDETEEGNLFLTIICMCSERDRAED